MSYRIGAAAAALLVAGLVPPGDHATEEKPRGPRPLVAAFFPEGPCLVGGKLYYVDYAAHSVMVWDGTDARRLWHRVGTGPSSVIALKDKEDTLLVSAYDEGTLIHLTREGKELAATKAPGGKKYDGPNDFVMDAVGGVYFTTSGTWDRDARAESKVYYRTPEGKVTEEANGIHYANGLAVVQGEAGPRLLVAESLQNRVLQFTIGKGGRLTGRAVWKRLGDIEPTPKDAEWATGPDGVKVDSRGNVYLCQFGAGRILVAKADGTKLRTILVPLKGVTNVALGKGEETLIVTAVKDSAEPYLGALYEIPNR